MKPNDIEIIEILLIKKLDGGFSENLKHQLFQDEDFIILFNDIEILITATRICAQKTTLQFKIDNLIASRL